MRATVESAPRAVAGRAERAGVARGAIAWVGAHFLITLALFALVVRVVAMLILDRALYALGRDGFIALDDRGYDVIAWQQAQLWQGGGTPIHPGERYLLNVYTYVEAALYFILGHHLIAMKLVNCLAGALTAIFAYLIARRLFGEAAARISGLAVAFFPSTLLWSLVNLKDAMFLCAVAGFFWLLTELGATGKARLIPPLLVALAIVGGLRSYMLLVLALVAPATLLLHDRARFPAKWRTVALLVGGCLLVIVINGQSIALFNPTLLVTQRFNAAQGAQSAFVPTPPAPPPPPQAAPAPSAAPILTGGDELTRRPVRSLVQWLPVGLAYALAAPFPWTADRLVEQVTIPEMFLWYGALATALVALVVHRRRWRDCLPLVAYVGGLLLLLAATQGNLGTLIRHRSMVIPFVLIFSGAGVAWLWRRWRRRGVPDVIAAAALD